LGGFSEVLDIVAIQKPTPYYTQFVLVRQMLRRLVEMFRANTFCRVRSAHLTLYIGYRIVSRVRSAHQSPRVRSAHLTRI